MLSSHIVDHTGHSLITKVVIYIVSNFNQPILNLTYIKTEPKTVTYNIPEAAASRDSGYVKRKFKVRRKKPLPYQATTATESRPYLPQEERIVKRKKVIKPFIPVSTTMPTTTPMPIVIEENDKALNRSQDDPRCKIRK